MPASAELLQRVPFLAALSPADREALAVSARQRRFRRGEAIFEKEDPAQALFIIEKGSVRIFLPGAQGVDLTLAVLGPGDFFGDLSLLDGRPRSAGAAALSEASLVTIERSDFMALLLSRPEAATAVLARVAQRLRDTNETAADLAFLDVAGRLAKKLLDPAETSGMKRADGILINLLVTQEELANMIGVTRESVNRNLSQFRRLGLIKNEGRRLVLRDPAALAQRGE